MDMRGRLEWVQRNRTRKDRTQRVGSRIQHLVRQLEAGAAAINGDLLRTIAQGVDAEFRRHCRILVVNSNLLLVSVDQASMVYTMRTRWQGLLGTLTVGRGVRRIAFRFGDEGVSVPEPTPQSDSGPGQPAAGGV